MGCHHRSIFVETFSFPPLPIPTEGTDIIPHKTHCAISIKSTELDFQNDFISTRSSLHHHPPVYLDQTNPHLRYSQNESSMKCDSHNLIIVIDEDNDDDVGDDVVKMQMR